MLVNLWDFVKLVTFFLTPCQLVKLGHKQKFE